MERKTLRSEVESLRRIFEDDDRPWLSLDRSVRSTICAMLDIALRSPDVVTQQGDRPFRAYEHLGDEPS